MECFRGLPDELAGECPALGLREQSGCAGIARAVMRPGFFVEGAGAAAVEVVDAEPKGGAVEETVGEEDGVSMSVFLDSVGGAPDLGDEVVVGFGETGLAEVLGAVGVEPLACEGEAGEPGWVDIWREDGEEGGGRVAEAEFAGS